MKVEVGAEAGHGPMKQRYLAVTFRLAVYDVLNARTSEKKGAPPTIDAAANALGAATARPPYHPRADESG